VFAAGVSVPHTRTYLALLDGQPVATSQLLLPAGVAGIYNVTCLPEARGQGIGAAVTLAPLVEARRRGYGVAVLQASDLGYSVYRRLGFRDYGRLMEYRLTPPADPQPGGVGS
jgi:ribosomal protein S18 acetylase RimI-like enzyme